VAKASGGSRQPAPPTKEKQRPAHEIRLGKIRVTIWANTKDDGSTWYSCVPTRSYKKDDSSWGNSSSFGRDDLLVLAEALRQAAAWVFAQMRNGGDAPSDEPIPE
jgi:hypothetical protein